MAKDYYLILGVSSDATQDEIKSAYRRQAKKCHPDCSGEGSEPFLAVGEAYEVLRDPGRRQAYDEKVALEKKSGEQMATGVRLEPLRRRRCPVEPLVPAPRSAGRRDPFPPSACPSLHLQVSLNREQALRGGRIRVLLPIPTTCPTCRGWGQLGFFECPRCFGSGSVVDERPVDIALPRGLVDGSEARVSLGRSGWGNLALTLHFRVDG